MSYLKKYDLLGPERRALVEEYLKGHDYDFSLEDKQLLDYANDRIDLATENWYQSCRDLFLSMEFNGKHLTWDQVDPFDYILGGMYLGMDFGPCCIFVPELNIDRSHENESYIEQFHKTDFKAKHGEENGVKILFDIEQWNYGFIHGPASGLKVSLLDPTSKPMMEFSSQSLRAGSDVKITVNPVVTYTTQGAIEKFDPIDRKCYVEGENELTGMSYNDGFAYDMTNCLINKGIMNIQWTCRCTPVFASFLDDYAK